MGFWVSQGFGELLVYPLGLFTFKTFTSKFPFGLSFLWKLGILDWLGIDLIVWLLFIVS